MNEQSFSRATAEAVDDRGERKAIKWNEPRKEVPRRPSVMAATERLGAAAVRLSVEAILARSCGPAEFDRLADLGPAVGTILIKMARKKDACGPLCEMRAGAVEALGHLRIDAAVDVLKGLASDRREEVGLRSQVALALGRIGSDACVDALGQLLLGDRDTAVRRAAAKGLGESGSLRSVSQLERAMTLDADGGVRRQAGVALSVLEKLHNAKLTDVRTRPPPPRRRPIRNQEAEQRYAARLAAKR